MQLTSNTFSEGTVVQLTPAVLNRRGQTPLHIAILRRHYPVVRILLRAASPELAINSQFEEKCFELATDDDCIVEMLNGNATVVEFHYLSVVYLTLLEWKYSISAEVLESAFIRSYFNHAFKQRIAKELHKTKEATPNPELYSFSSGILVCTHSSFLHRMETMEYRYRIVKVTN